MNNESLEHLYSWAQRAAAILPTIRAAFPVTLINRECLQKLIRDASRPLTPGAGAFKRIHAAIFLPVVDDELLEFLKLLQDHDWTQIDWSQEWIRIPILPDAAFGYCLPGIMHAILMDDGFGYEAVPSLLDCSFPRFFAGSDATKRNLDGFDMQQKQVIAEVLRHIRDYCVDDDARLQKFADDLLLDLALA